MSVPENITYEAILKEIEAHPHRLGLLAQGLAILHPGLPNYQKEVNKGAERQYLIRLCSETLHVPKGQIVLFDYIFSKKGLISSKEKGLLFKEPQLLLGPHTDDFVTFMSKIESGELQIPDKSVISQMRDKVNFKSRHTIYKPEEEQNLELEFENMMENTFNKNTKPGDRRFRDGEAIQSLLRVSVLNAVRYSIFNSEGRSGFINLPDAENISTLAGLAGMEILSGFAKPIFKPLFKAQFKVPQLPPL